MPQSLTAMSGSNPALAPPASSAPIVQVSPLAGLATYKAASVAGYSVEENVSRLLRYAWIEKRAMDVALDRLAPTPEWEIKEALGLHLHLDAEHVAALRARIRRNAQPSAAYGRNLRPCP